MSVGVSKSLSNLKTELATIDTALTALNAKIATDKAPTSTIPTGGTFTQGVSTVVTTTTAVEVIAAPAASNHLVITRVIAVNITTAEIATLMLLDSTPANLCPMVASLPAEGNGLGGAILEFPNGLVCASAKAFQAKANATTGDVFVYAEGYTIAD